MAGCIPIIDLLDFPGQTQKLVGACEELGIFRVINHKISAKTISDMKMVIKSLLDLPLEIKCRNTDVIKGSGYMPPDEYNPLFESLGLYDSGSPEAVEAFCTQLDASPQQREIILRYSQAIYELTMDIGCKIAEGLGLTGSTNDLFKGWPLQFRINKYNFTTKTVGSNGVQLHTDPGFLTILQEDENVGGLEMMDKKTGEFLPVDYTPGTLLVIFGDIAEVWSNGRFSNLKHRVQCKEATIRVSISSFLLGPKEAVVEPPPKLVDSEHPRLYVPITFEDYRNLRRTSKSGSGEALALIRAN